MLTTQAMGTRSSERACEAAAMPAGGRLVCRDVARGIALLGSGLMNVKYFGRPLAHIHVGPVQWLWRACTYGRFPRMRTEPARSP